MMRNLTYPYKQSAQYALHGSEVDKQFVHDTHKIYMAYNDLVYANITLQLEIDKLKQENKFLMNMVDEYENEINE